MKIKSVLLLAVATLGMYSCSESENNNPNNNQTVVAVREAVSSGTWRVSYHFDETDETADFINHIFTFNSANNSVTVVRGDLTYTGTFSITASGSDDNSLTPDVDFNLGFVAPATADLIDLTDDWDVVTYSNTEIELIDISGGNGTAELLTFTKIQ
jgi:hypothetical protein